MTNYSLPAGDRDSRPAAPPGRQAALAEAREALGATMPKAEFVDVVAARARRLGWMVHRCGEHRTGSDPGFPTLLCVHARHGRVVTAHLGSHEPSEATKTWLATLARTPGIETAVWVTGDGFDAIEDVLSRGGNDVRPLTGIYDDDDGGCTMCGGEGYDVCNDWIQCTSEHTPIHDPDGNVIGFLCHCTACGGTGQASDQSVW